MCVCVCVCVCVIVVVFDFTGDKCCIQPGHGGVDMKPGTFIACTAQRATDTMLPA